MQPKLVDAIDALARNNFDRSSQDAVKRLVVKGKEVLFLGFFSWGFESVGLFKADASGKNIFHHLAHSPMASMLLKNILLTLTEDLSVSSAIAVREIDGSDDADKKSKLSSTLKKCLNAPDRHGYTPLHIAINNNNAQGYKVLEEFNAFDGRVLVEFQRSEGLVQAGVSYPLSYILEDQVRATGFLSAVLRLEYEDFFAKLFASVDLRDGLPIVTEVLSENYGRSPQIDVILVKVFSAHWRTLVTSEADKLKIGRLLNFADAEYQCTKEITMAEWGSLLDCDINRREEIRPKLLEKCAPSFFTRRVRELLLNDLLKGGAINELKFGEMKRYFEVGSVAEASPEAAVVSLEPSRSAVVVASIDAEEKSGGSVASASVMSLPVASTASSLSVSKAGGSVAVKRAVDEEKGVASAGSAAASVMSLPVASAASSLSVSKAGGLAAVKRAVDEEKGVASASSAALDVALVEEDVVGDFPIKDFADKLHEFLRGDDSSHEDLSLQTWAVAFSKIRKVWADYVDLVAEELGLHEKLSPKEFFRLYSDYLLDGAYVAGDRAFFAAVSDLKDACGYGAKKDLLDVVVGLCGAAIKNEVISDSSELLNIGMKHNSSKIIKYLLETQFESPHALIPIIPIDWRSAISSAVKYQNPYVIQCYIDSGASIVENIHSSGALTLKSSVLNQCLGASVTFATRVINLESIDLMDEWVKCLAATCCISVKLMEGKKVDYAKYKTAICVETFDYLQQLNTCIKFLNQDKVSAPLALMLLHVRGLVIEAYRTHDKKLGLDGDGKASLSQIETFELLKPCADLDDARSVKSSMTVMTQRTTVSVIDSIRRDVEFDYMDFLSRYNDVSSIDDGAAASLIGAAQEHNDGV